MFKMGAFRSECGWRNCGDLLGAPKGFLALLASGFSLPDLITLPSRAALLVLLEY